MQAAKIGYVKIVSMSQAKARKEFDSRVHRRSGQQGRSLCLD